MPTADELKPDKAGACGESNASNDAESETNGDAFKVDLLIKRKKKSIQERLLKDNKDPGDKRSNTDRSISRHCMPSVERVDPV